MLKHVLSQTQLRDKVVNMIIESGQARLPTLPLRKASLVSAPTPLLRLRDFHSIDSAQKDSAAFPSGSLGDFCLLSEQTPGKTMSIAADASTSTNFPLRTERNQKMPLTVLTFSASYE